MKMSLLLLCMTVAACAAKVDDDVMTRFRASIPVAGEVIFE